MKRKSLFSVAMLRQGVKHMAILSIASFSLYAQAIEIPGKQIFIPSDLKEMNLEDTASVWSYSRMALTPNFAIFWQKGFGTSLANPPQLQGRPMQVDLENLKAKLERFYAYYRDTLKFIHPGSLADKYRMMVMINYSLEGTAYGGDYDGTIGAFWAAPNRLQDPSLNCVAHELGHSFQSQAGIDVRSALGFGPEQPDQEELARREAEEPNRPKGDTPAQGDKPKPGDMPGIGGGGIYEMTSQWMLWHVNPYWVRDELYHWDAYRRQPHKAFLSWENVYHAPYVLEGWSQRHGMTIMSRIFREGFHREDPVDAYKRLTGTTQEAFCDETFETNRHTVKLDFPHAYAETRPYVGSSERHPGFATTLVANADTITAVDARHRMWLHPVADEYPEDYGFNVIPIRLDGRSKVRVDFEAIDAKDDANNYMAGRAAEAGWRWGFVAVDSNGRCSYPPMQKSRKGTITFNPDGYKELLLVVMGAPTEHRHAGFGRDNKQAQWPYRLRVR